MAGRRERAGGSVGEIIAGQRWRLARACRDSLHDRSTCPRQPHRVCVCACASDCILVNE